jgi:hypothetical protein
MEVQMITMLQKDSALRAHEITHCVTEEIPPVLASLMRNELGDPCFASKHFSAWYGYAHCRGRKVPFVLRWDDLGRSTLSYPLFTRDLLSEMIGNLVPGVQIIELPRGRVA